MTLPSLSKKTESSYVAVPKRYEETKPVLIQGLTHRRILDLGNNIYIKAADRFEKEKLSIIQATKEAMWEEMEREKKEAIANALKKAETQHETHIRKLRKEHNRTLKDELSRLSIDLDRQKQQEMEEINEKGNRLLKETMQEIEKLWKQNLEKAVAEVRADVKLMAVENAARQESKHRVLMAEAATQAAEEQTKALATQDATFARRAEEKVRLARAQEQETTRAMVNQVSTMYEQRLATKATELAGTQQEVQRLQKEINVLEEAKCQADQELKDMQLEFQKFISLVKPFQDSDSNYVVPPISSREAT